MSFIIVSYSEKKSLDGWTDYSVSIIYSAILLNLLLVKQLQFRRSTLPGENYPSTFTIPPHEKCKHLFSGSTYIKQSGELVHAKEFNFDPMGGWVRQSSWWIEILIGSVSQYEWPQAPLFDCSWNSQMSAITKVINYTELGANMFFFNHEKFYILKACVIKSIFVSYL